MRKLCMVSIWWSGGLRTIFVRLLTDEPRLCWAELTCLMETMHPGASRDGETISIG